MLVAKNSETFGRGTRFAWVPFADYLTTQDGLLLATGGPESARYFPWQHLAEVVRYAWVGILSADREQTRAGQHAPRLRLAAHGPRAVLVPQPEGVAAAVELGIQGEDQQMHWFTVASMDYTM